MENQIQPTSPLPPQPELPVKSTNMVKPILVILLYLLFFPVGILLMWLWMKWPKWMKIALTCAPIIIVAGGITLVYYSYSSANSVLKVSPKKYAAKPTPTLDPTSTWQIYTNMQDGYEIKYPDATVLVKPAKDEAGNEVTRFSSKALLEEVKKHCCAEVDYFFEISAQKNTSHKSINDPTSLFTKAIIDNAKDHGSKGVEQTTLGGKKAWRIVNTGGLTDDVSIYTIHNDTIYHIYYFPKDYAPDATTSDQMIKTFKFSDMNQPLDISTWKIYIQPKEKYMVKYPGDRPVDENAEEEYVTFYELGTNMKDNNRITDASFIGIRKVGPFSDEPKGNLHEQGVDFVTGWQPRTVDGVKGIYYETHQCAPTCLNIIALPYLNGQETIELFMSRDENPDIFNNFVSTFKFSQQEKSRVMCTQEAKLCSDGKTYVGRTGPNCEFAACPR